MRPVGAGAADLLARGGREVGGGAVVGRGAREDAEREGGPSMRGLA